MLSFLNCLNLTIGGVLGFITLARLAHSPSKYTKRVCTNHPTGGAVLGDSSAVVTIKSPQLFLLLEESSLTQVAALDAITLMRDPFPLIPPVNFGPAADPNTRVIVFVTNLQLAPGDTSSAVTVNLVDSNGQSYVWRRKMCGSFPGSVLCS